MRWMRIFKLSLLMAAIAGVVIGFSPALRWARGELDRRAHRPDPVVATPDETRAIVDAVVQRMDYEGVPPPPPKPGEPDRPKPERELMLVDQSICFGASSACIPQAAEFVRSSELDALAPRKFREELLLANQTPGPLALSGLRGTQVMRSSEIRELFQGGDWGGFHHLHPASSGYARITRPVLSEDRRRALVFITHRCSSSCGSSTLLRLDRTKRGWRVADEKLLTVL